MHFNIWMLNNWNERRPLLVNVIKKYKPDIISFNECAQEKDKSRSQINEIREILTDYKFYVYQPIPREYTNHHGLKLGHMGNALLSKYKLTNKKYLELPKSDLEFSKMERRVALSAIAHVKGQKILVTTTHLNWKLADTVTRQKQVRALTDFVWKQQKELHPKSNLYVEVEDVGFPPVIMGDFNAQPQSDEIRYMHR
eukprot:UN26264